VRPQHTWRLHAERATPLGRRRSSARSGRSQQLWTLPSQTVSRFFRVDAKILPTPRFCRRQDFVNAKVLLTPTFCQRQYFVDANILSTPVFCQRQHFVNASILLTPVFCRRQINSVDAYVLSAPIFCRRQCFVGTNILLPLIFLIMFTLRMIILFSIDNCVLCIS
jgi:hypothetical protein